MNNGKRLIFIGISVIGFTLSPIENEFIMVVEEKKIDNCYSRQQCIELESELPLLYSNALSCFNRLYKVIVNCQRASMEELGFYYNGDKSSVWRSTPKRQLGDLYNKNMKRKKIVDSLIITLDSILKELKSLEKL